MKNLLNLIMRLVTDPEETVKEEARALRSPHMSRRSKITLVLLIAVTLAVMTVVMWILPDTRGGCVKFIDEGCPVP